MLRLQAPLPDEYLDASPEDLADRIAAARTTLGERLVILGHHYQRDDVIRWAHARGDSFKLAQFAASRAFMAESTDVLTEDRQAVVIPDLNAGCSMADMASAEQVRDAWDDLDAVCGTEGIVPITYMNSSAALKAFVGERGGAVCTSSNARGVLEWAFARGAEKILFFPDQHLGRNTAVAMGHALEDCAVWNPHRDCGGLEERAIKEATFLLWRGHCSVHQRFTPAQVEKARADHPDVNVIVHPECAHEVVRLADHVGSTERIIKTVTEAPAGTVWAVGTEIHLVTRVAAENPDKTVFSLDPLVCPCSTMFRIDSPHLAWTLDNLVAGRVVNRITVEPGTARWARVALDRMLSIT